LSKVTCNLIGLVLVLLLTAGITASCGSVDYTKNELQTLENHSNKELKPVTLTFYFKGIEKAYAKDVLKELAERAHDELNVELNFQWMPENYINVRGFYENNMVKKLTSKDSLDGVYLFKHQYNPNFDFVTFARAGNLKDLSGMLQKYAPILYKRCTKEQLAAATVDGKLMAIPDIFPRVNALYAIVREDLVKKYKIPEIRTYDDYERYLKVIKEKELNIIAPGMVRLRENSLTLFAYISNYFVFDVGQQLVYKQNDPEMKMMAWEQTPEFSKAADYLTRWEKNGYLVWCTANESNPLRAAKQISDNMLSGKVFSTLAYENIADDLNADLSVSNDNNWEFKAYQLYPDAKTERLSPVEGCLAFKADSPNVERALMFLNWIQSSQNNYDLLMYGREGTDYTLEGEKYKLPEGIKNELESPYIGWGGREVFMNSDYNRLAVGTSENSISNFTNYNSQFPLNMDFNPDFSDMMSETNSRLSFLNSQVDQVIRDGSYSKANMDPDLLKMGKEATDMVLTKIKGQISKWKEDRVKK